MKRLHLVLFMILFSSMLIFSCDSQEDSVSTPSKIAQENFAVKNIEILNELGNYFPKEDVIFTISKDNNEKLFSIYKIIGTTRDQIDFGSFAKKKYQTNNEGTTCDGKFSCGRLIYQCLSNGDKALISNGGCGENGNPDDYCVVCVPEEI